jgi:hypothetical protein
MLAVPLPGQARPDVHVAGYATAGIIALAVIVSVVLIGEWRRLVGVLDRHCLVRLAFVGVWFWVVPSVLVGITLRWQLQDLWGQSYVPVVFETFGFALVMTAVMGGLKRTSQGSGRVRAATTSFALLLLSLVALRI